MRRAAAIIVVGVALAACPTRHIHSTTPTSGVIESPGYPSPYISPLDCSFNITTVGTNVIELAFVAFDLAPVSHISNQCLDSYLIVIVIDRHGKQHVGRRLCGSSIPARIETMQSAINVQFVAAKSTNHRGFRIQYRIRSEASILQPPGAEMSTCGGRSGDVGALSGVITSPGFPGPYPKNSTCTWLIRVEPRQRIYVRIQHLHLAPTIAECERASLHIIDGYRHQDDDDNDLDRNDDATDMARFCGSQLYYADEGMKSFVSSANRLLIRLRTQDGPPGVMLEESEPIGFKMMWTAIEGMIDESPLTKKSVTIGVTYPNDSCHGQFVCDGGLVCIEQGHGVCASRSRLCIHQSLVCDGAHNCVEGDYSDEKNCYTTRMAITASTAFISLIVVLLVLIWCDRRRRNRKMRKLVEERRRARQQADVKNGGACAQPVRMPNR